MRDLRGHQETSFLSGGGSDNMYVLPVRALCDFIDTTMIYSVFLCFVFEENGQILLCPNYENIFDFQ